MKNKLDLQIKSELEKSKPQIPNGYDKKISDTLEKISEIPKVSKKKYLIRVAAVMACIILAGAGSIYAAKNYLGQRLKKMDTAEIEQYNDRTQSSIMGADSYSRNLTEAESERLSLLDNQYLSEGRFPESEIKQLENEVDVTDYSFYFVSSESKFYLPEREMTDEELLELIDFYYKRDYSVQNENNLNKNSARKCKIDENDAVNLSRESIKNVFGMDVSESDFTIELQPIEEADKLLHYLLNFTIDTDKSISILIDADDGSIDQMRLNCYDVYSENKVLDKKEYEECYLFIRQNIIEKMKADLKGVKLYYMLDNDHLLKNGTLKYIFELENGAGYVVNYSLNKEMIYYLRYIDDISCFEKTLEGNEQELGDGPIEIM